MQCLTEIWPLKRNFHLEYFNRDLERKKTAPLGIMIGQFNLEGGISKM